MDIKKRIYALTGLSPETIAVTFAKCSRSSLPFDEIAKELTDEQSADFNEKWVVNFGHGSVAEHAFFNIAVENVSLIAVENIQSNRLASYTEKSSRYQLYDRKRIHIPKELDEFPELKKEFTEAVNELFDVYEKSIDPVKKAIEKIYPNTENKPVKIWQAKIKSKWIDICRFALPNCVLANLGVSMNARSWEYAITKMLSSPLLEVQEIGKGIKKVAIDITPTLVKYADRNDFYIENDRFIADETSVYSEGAEKKEFSRDAKLEVELVDYEEGAEDKVLAGLMYRHNCISYTQALSQVRKMNPPQKEKIFESILKKAKNIYDKPPRELEYPYYTFDVLLDQGAYYDLKRNRIMTQTPQTLTGEYGYFTPELINEIGLGGDYRKAMDNAHRVARKLKEKNPHLSQYITTKATARRFLMKMNLRQAYYFIGLRSRTYGHFMYRKVAQMVFDRILSVHPMAAKYIDVDQS